MSLATLRLACHPQGRSFNMHCIALAPFYHLSMCIFNHHGTPLTCSIDHHYVLSTMTSIFYLSVTTWQHVITCYELSNCHMFLTVYLCNRVIGPPDVLSNHPHEPVQVIVHKLSMVLFTTNTRYWWYYPRTWVINGVVVVQVIHSIVYHDHTLATVLSITNTSYKQYCLPWT